MTFINLTISTLAPHFVWITNFRIPPEKIKDVLTSIPKSDLFCVTVAVILPAPWLPLNGVQLWQKGLLPLWTSLNCNSLDCAHGDMQSYFMNFQYGGQQPPKYGGVSALG